MNYVVCFAVCALAVTLCVSKFFISGEKWALIDKKLCIALACAGASSGGGFYFSSLAQ